MLLTEGGDPLPVLTDFGFAKKLLNTVNRSVIRADFLGTLVYAAPEAIEFQNQPQTTTVDAWAFGCLLHEMITGRTPCDTIPWNRNTFNEKIMAVCKLLQEGQLAIQSFPTTVPATMETQNALHLINLLLQLPNRRPTISANRHHPFFTQSMAVASTAAAAASAVVGLASAASNA